LTYSYTLNYYVSVEHELNECVYLDCKNGRKQIVKAKQLPDLSFIFPNMSSPNSRLSYSHLRYEERMGAIQENLNRNRREQLDIARQLASTPSPIGIARNKPYRGLYYTAQCGDQCQYCNLPVC
jgi:hypothetical protein